MKTPNTMDNIWNGSTCFSLATCVESAGQMGGGEEDVVGRTGVGVSV